MVWGGVVGAGVGAWHRHAPTGALGCWLPVVGLGADAPVPQPVPGDFSRAWGGVVGW
ncbi:MAG TPA: hypothetical protein VJ183_09535 [Chloroflexia bacterium]|nr:hypothetical protein [Chloroflexia bacterium]